jgi:lipid A 3-O-deacylase PagL
MRRALLAGIVALGLVAADVAAQTPPPASANEPSFALLAGFGYAVKINYGRTEEQSLLVQPQASFRLGARFEYVPEAHFARYFRPDGYAAGLVPVGVRYLFGSGSATTAAAAVVPYFGVGAGFCWTDLHIVELSRRFNFILQGGFGVRGPLGDRQGWMLEARWYHYSNANTVLPNLGFNAIEILGGWRLR